MPLTREEIFDIWAPPNSIWSSWVKPIIFSSMLSASDGVLEGESATTDANLSWLPAAHSAIVVDLPGAMGVHVGLSLASHGYRPVPLYNSVPSAGDSGLVDMKGISRAIRGLTDDLARLPLRDDAPPAFLIDRNRMGTKSFPVGGDFDNRWMVLPQDFPSARKLLSHGVKHALLLSLSEPIAYGDDLAHILLRWKLDGITPSYVNRITGKVQTLDVHKPSHFRWLFHRWLVTLGLRRNSAGGFGSPIPLPPTPGTGGGGYWVGGFG